jgi:hypothetical protein
MWLDYKQYKHWPLVDQLLLIAQQELSEFLKDKSPYAMSDYKWFEEQYGHELDPVIRNWYAVPTVRGGNSTPWGYLMPKLEAASLALPGVSNFTLNAIAPGGVAPFHTDYDYDMREDLSKIKRAYVILLGVDIPETDDISKCGFELGGERVLLKTNDIVSFDGNVIHGSWNYTDNWRYTINMDITEEFWNVA